MSIEDGYDGFPGLSQLDPMYVKVDGKFQSNATYILWIHFVDNDVADIRSLWLLSTHVQTRYHLLADPCNQEIFSCILFRYTYTGEFK